MAHGSSAPSASDALSAAPPSPSARRARTPKWLDLRLLLGLVLVIASVVVGAQVVSAADETVRVWALERDLSAGTILAADDLRAVDVKLEDHAAMYVAASADPVGQTLGRDVSAGEMLPIAALSEQSELVALALSVRASNVPVTVARGDRVSIYATITPPPGADAVATTSLVVSTAAVADLSERSSGALSVGSGELQIVVQVPECLVPAILDSTAGAVLTVVEVDASPRQEAVC